MMTAIVVLGATVASAQITGSDHDFSNQTWSNGTICLPCHTTHDGETAFVAPLWNHEVTTATFTMYTSSTLNGTVDPQPADVSKACLSCHDGTVALENFGGNTGGTTFIVGPALIGTDLSNDHPISIVYSAGTGAGQDPELNPTSSAYADGTIADYLFAGKVECATCHDVHNGGAVGGNPSLLVENPAGSAICLRCHAK
jgi:predicted CXXCH cytochrome family protein